ncbi:SulP family inorganic anion transporter [Sulfurimonas lithotrophica]|uniref:SulP family inorganic anion transporter n=1 Tax=Sulfurimonas lithotrophica TaxID=2590022 RepID=A0A5P8NZJ3_9BACT|nr:SulP family inorganic anion transporter [Sulfurimonas lithotrophica]QFR48844.1 SulP family inorganic anion transporter [Sulfurimonas lithotrophica]
MNNLFGGLTASIVALPLAIAFGISSGLGAGAGIFGAIFLGFFASLFGGTKTQISGPTGPMTVISASVVAVLGPNLALVFTTFLLAGFFQIVFGLLKIGKFVKFIPYPVISGFMNGIGLIIILLQINIAFGLHADSSVIGAILNIPNSIINLNPQAFFLSMATLLVLYFSPKQFTNKVPAPLIALILLSVVANILSLEVFYVSDIPTGLPSFVEFDFDMSHLSFILVSALTLAVLGTIDSLLTSLVADSLTKDKHNSNKELIGQGVGNMISSLFGGLPGAGATMRTVSNIKSGATSKVSGMMHSVFLLLILLMFAPLASKIPMPVLAGILIKVGFDIFDYKMLKQLNIIPKYDVSVMMIVFFLTVFVDLIVAVGVGVVLSAFLIIHRLVKESEVNVYGEEVEENKDDRIFRDGLVRIVNIKGPFFFGSTSFILDKVDKIYDVKNVVIDCSLVSFMDLSAIYALSETIEKLKSSGSEVYIVADEKRKEKLIKLGITQSIDASKIIDSQMKALRAINKVF